MSTTTIDSGSRADRERETAEARADLLRRAEAQGVQAFVSPEDFAGDAEITSNFDIDEFLRQVREGRDRISRRGME